MVIVLPLQVGLETLVLVVKTDWSARRRGTALVHLRCYLGFHNEMRFGGFGGVWIVVEGPAINANNTAEKLLCVGAEFELIPDCFAVSFVILPVTSLTLSSAISGMIASSALLEGL